MQQQVFITGIGLVTPHGIGKQIVWNKLCENQLAISQLNDFALAVQPQFYAGKITNFEPLDYFSQRIIKKLDVFTMYAWLAGKLAVSDSGMDLASVDLDRVGVYVGNSLGGWKFTDHQLRRLYQLGKKYLSPFLATAWFPTAPQGQISIGCQFKGHSKTIDCGFASGLLSVGCAAQAIAEGRADCILAGGVEAMLNPFMLTCLRQAYQVDEMYSLASENNYFPFEPLANGWLPGEGAGFVLLENQQHMQSRGGSPYAVISGFAHQYNGHCCGLVNAMQQAITAAQCQSSDIDVLMVDGIASVSADQHEQWSIKQVFDSQYMPIISIPKKYFGHLRAAAGAVDIALASLSIKHQTVLNPLDKNIGTPSKPIKQIQVNARDTSLIGASIIISKTEHGG